MPGQAVSAVLQVPELLVLADDRQLKVVAWSDAATLGSLAQAGALKVRLNGRELAVQRLLRAAEAAQDGPGAGRFRVTAIVQRPAGLAVRAGQAATITW